jgi:hypothetical protein
MKKYVIFGLVTMFFSNIGLNAQAQLTNNSQELTQIDFNYINKGIWDLAKNGYDPRKDLTLVLTYGRKQNQSDWYFMCHKICKNGEYMGYVLTAKPNSLSEQVTNLFFLNQLNEFADKHNFALLSKYPISSNTGMFLYRTTTTHLYKLDGKCPSSNGAN